MAIFLFVSMLFVTLQQLQQKLESCEKNGTVILNGLMVWWVIYSLFLQATFFFNSASVLLNLHELTFKCRLVFHKIYKHHHRTKTLFYVLYLCSCLDLGSLLPYLCDLIFIFIFIFIMINRVIPWINTRLLFCLFFSICPITFGW